MKLPNFLIIGVEKAGTTSIYGYLKQHPEVYMSPLKETNFFEKDWREQQNQPNNNPKKIANWEQYCALFQDAKDEKAIGEASPNYLFHYKKSIKLIKEYLPQAKLIAIIRNPTERAYSDYLMHIRDAIGPDITLLEQIEKKANTSYTILKGYYYTALKHYLENFGSQVSVLLYDDLAKDSLKFMRNIYNILEIDNNFCPDVSKKAQASKIPKNKFVHKMLQTRNPVREMVASGMKVILPVKLRQNIRSGLLNLNSDKKKDLEPEIRQKLVDLYREDILKLQDLIQKDLSSWLTVSN